VSDAGALVSVGLVGVLWLAVALVAWRKTPIAAGRWAVTGATGVALAIMAVWLRGRWGIVFGDPGVALAGVALFGGLWGAQCAGSEPGVWPTLGAGIGGMLLLAVALRMALARSPSATSVGETASGLAYVAGSGALYSAVLLARWRRSGESGFGMLLRSALALQAASLAAYGVALERATGDLCVATPGFLHRAAVALVVAMAALDEQQAEPAARRPAIAAALACGLALLVLLGSLPATRYAAGGVQP